ncbi:alpha/beta hydrolase [Rhodovibrio salinarum]|nr:alpha/beta hydrolase [Rhodovibrio salinarum]
MMAEIIYRDWDQERLDAEVNLRARWPDHADFIERWARDSSAVRGRRHGLIDLAYGASPGERLDLFPVSGATAAPVLAFIHGGYWQALDKGHHSDLAPAFVDQGIAFASLNYDLAPKAKIGDMIEQVRAALAYLHDHAGRLGLDPERIFVAGHSAGGHLAVSALDRDWPAQRGLPRDLVKGALSLSGVYDLEPIRLSYHQAVLGLDADEVAAWSPRRSLPTDAGPLLLAVGGAETNEFLLQQEEFLAAWRGAGLRAGAVDLPGRHHFDVVETLGAPDHPLHQALAGLIARGDLE